jgi:predicted RNA-binding protein with PIN domain
MDPRGHDEAGWAVSLIVDGMNVIGTEPDGWWRDRAGARRRLVEALGPLCGQGEQVTVVFDGRAAADEAVGAATTGVIVRFAPGGPNAADDAIVDMVTTLPDRSDIVVVTSDRALVERVRQLGAKVEGAKAFRGRLGGPT